MNPKFHVRHHKRGELDPEDYFVLVPDRDPAAVAAIRAYASATSDTMLAAELASWADRIEGVDSAHASAEVLTKVPVWTALLAEEVRTGRMDIETALQRIAGHTAAALGGA